MLPCLCWLPTAAHKMLMMCLSPSPAEAVMGQQTVLGWGSLPSLHFHSLGPLTNFPASTGAASSGMKDDSTWKHVLATPTAMAQNAQLMAPQASEDTFSLMHCPAQARVSWLRLSHVYGPLKISLGAFGSSKLFCADLISLLIGTGHQDGLSSVAAFFCKYCALCCGLSGDLLFGWLHAEAQLCCCRLFPSP